MSKEALVRFGKQAVNSHICVEDGNDEDVDWGLCMEKLGVTTSKSTDKEGRTLFHPLTPVDHFLGKGITKKWVWEYSAVKTWVGILISKNKYFLLLFIMIKMIMQSICLVLFNIPGTYSKPSQFILLLSCQTKNYF